MAADIPPLTSLISNRHMTDVSKVQGLQMLLGQGRFRSLDHLCLARDWPFVLMYAVFILSFLHLIHHLPDRLKWQEVSHRTDA